MTETYEKEIELMPMGAKVMTFECGMRFLTDYLQGDKYFKIHREGQNLDRCRTQFKLVEDMEQKWYTMNEIVKSIVTTRRYYCGQENINYRRSRLYRKSYGTGTSE